MKVEKLTTDLATGNDRQRRAASYKLSKLQDPSSVPHLIAAFKDKDHSVRRNVIAALRAIGTKEAVEFLEANRIEAVDISEKTASASDKIRTKGCLLSWLAAIVTVVIGLVMLSVLSSSDDSTAGLSRTGRGFAYVVMAVGFVSFYFVRKFYNDKAAKVERAQPIEAITLEPLAQKAMETVQMPAGTVCPECGYVNEQPQNICRQCGKSYAEMSWDKPGDYPEREGAEIPPISSEERDQILEEVIADHEKKGFSLTERTDTSVQMFKPRFTTNDILLRALLPGFLLFVVFSGIPIGNESTARMVESLGPGWLTLIALLYVGLPFMFKRDQAIRIMVDESGSIETQDISDSVPKEQNW